jgi:hypothetical protein
VNPVANELVKCMDFEWSPRSWRCEPKVENCSYYEITEVMLHGQGGNRQHSESILLLVKIIHQHQVSLETLRSLVKQVLAVG